MKNTKIRQTFLIRFRAIAPLSAALVLSALAWGAGSQAFAETKMMKVLERRRGNGYAFVLRPLDNLVRSDAFDGVHFKVVEGKSGEPVPFDHPELALKAATAYYHLTKARRFWIESLDSDYVRNMDKITVRLEISSRFSDLAHYAGEGMGPSYNNAYTVPPGETPSWVPEERRDKWGLEVWFNPSKRISTAQLADSGDNPLARQLELLRRPVVDKTADSFTRSVLNHIFYPGSVSGTLWESALRHAGTLALAYGVVEASRRMDSLFMEDWYYLDTAMIPEIIYHEFSHAALSNHLAPTHATAVSEGIADYFAALVAGKTRMYQKIVGYSNNIEKDALNETLYHPVLEKSWKATGDFALSLLWKLRAALKGTAPWELGERGVLADRIVMRAASYLDTSNSDIRGDLPRALMRACRKICPPLKKREALETMLQVFEEKGL